jgi:hypothetical protein
MLLVIYFIGLITLVFARPGIGGTAAGGWRFDNSCTRLPGVPFAPATNRRAKNGIA